MLGKRVEAGWLFCTANVWVGMGQAALRRSGCSCQRGAAEARRGEDATGRNNEQGGVEGGEGHTWSKTPVQERWNCACVPSGASGVWRRLGAAAAGLAALRHRSERPEGRPHGGRPLACGKHLAARGAACARLAVCARRQARAALRLRQPAAGASGAAARDEDRRTRGRSRSKVGECWGSAWKLVGSSAQLISVFAAPRRVATWRKVIG